MLDNDYLAELHKKRAISFEAALSVFKITLQQERL